MEVHWAWFYWSNGGRIWQDGIKHWVQEDHTNKTHSLPQALHTNFCAAQLSCSSTRYGFNHELHLLLTTIMLTCVDLNENHSFKLEMEIQDMQWHNKQVTVLVMITYWIHLSYDWCLPSSKVLETFIILFQMIFVWYTIYSTSLGCHEEPRMLLCTACCVDQTSPVANPNQRRLGIFKSLH